jgi:superfamily II RNA helicase
MPVLTNQFDGPSELSNSSKPSKPYKPPKPPNRRERRLIDKQSRSKHRFIHVPHGSEVVPDDATAEFLPRIKSKTGYYLKPWQTSAFSVVSKGTDLIVKAGTSSGKTAVILSMLARKDDAIVLVVVPLLSIMQDAVHPLQCQILMI